jgi:hypothetical protein
MLERGNILSRPNDLSGILPRAQKFVQIERLQDG